MFVTYAPINGWIPYLSAGWKFVNDIAEPMPGSHGVWSVMLERDA